MIGWIVCRLSHRGFRFSHFKNGRAYASCKVCGRLASAPILPPGSAKR